MGIIHDFELVECEEDSRFWAETTSVPTSPSSAKLTVGHPGGLRRSLWYQSLTPCPQRIVYAENATYNGATRHLAEAKLKEERRRRIVLEGVLADVCRDLESQGTLPAAVLQALTKIEELTDGAMVLD